MHKKFKHNNFHSFVHRLKHERLTNCLNNNEINVCECFEQNNVDVNVVYDER